MKLTWLGHSAVHLEMGGKNILVDPFFTGNSTYPAGYEDRLERVDYIALTHGHSDHLGDTARLAKKYGSTVLAQFEICQYLGGKGLDKFQPMNIGGSVRVDGVTVSMVHAQHSSAVIENGVPVTMGDPAGLVFASSGAPVVYHAGDTGLFSDMALIQRLYKPEIGLLPIGDRFTMGPEAAAIACNEFLDLKYIVPIHWGTFPLLTGDPQKFKSLVRRGEVLLPNPGNPVEL